MAADQPTRDHIRQAVQSVAPDLFAFLRRLVTIPSLPGDEAGAHACAADAMRALALHVRDVRATRQDVENHPAFCDDGLPIESRPNIIGRWTGSGGGRSLILNGHLDVVSPGDESRWKSSPWSARVDGRRLFGRGACDMKAGVAAAVYAVAALQRAGVQPRGDVLIETVSGEESGGMGTLTTIVNGYRADAAIILEPTGLALCPVQAGALTFRLTVPGRAAHGALRQSGVSAIDKMQVLLQAIEGFEGQRHVRRESDRQLAALFPRGQLIAPISVGILRAGEWPSSVPESAVAEGRFGVFPGERVADARRAFDAAIATAAQRDAWLSSHPPLVEWFEGQFESGMTPVDAPIVQTVAAAHAEVTGKPAAVEGVPYGSDLRLFTNHAGVPAVLYGPGHIEQAHAVDEFVDLDEVVTACEVIAATIVDWCG